MKGKSLSKMTTSACGNVTKRVQMRLENKKKIRADDLDVEYMEHHMWSSMKATSCFTVNSQWSGKIKPTRTSIWPQWNTSLPGSHKVYVRWIPLVPQQPIQPASQEIILKFSFSHLHKSFRMTRKNFNDRENAHVATLPYLAIPWSIVKQ